MNIKLKTVFFTLLLLTFIILIPVLSKTNLQIYNIITNAPVSEQGYTGLKIQHSLLRYFGEPFFGPANYILHWQKYKQQLIVLFFWTIFFVAGYTIITSTKNKTFGQTVVKTITQLGLSGFLLTLYVLYTLLAPIPCSKIVTTDKRWKLIDVHSHTYYSHDGIFSPEQNNKWHKLNNNDVWFITDHDKITESKYTKALLGTELLLEGNHFVFLGIKDKEKFSSCRTLKEKIQEIHRQNGYVLVVEYWRDNGLSLKQLVDLRIDGIEIINSGYPETPREVQQKAIAFCKTNNLTTWAGTNWHGWGNSCHTITAVRHKNYKTLSIEDLFSAIKNGELETLPLKMNRAEYYGNIRIIFDPF